MSKGCLWLWLRGTCKLSEKGGIAGLGDVVDVPEAGATDGVIGGMPAEPPVAGRVDGVMWGVVVTEEGDGVALDVGSNAVGAGSVVDGEPEEGHGADVVANGALEGPLALAGLPGRAGSDGPVSGDVVGPAVAADKSSAYVEAKHRAAVIAASGI